MTNSYHASFVITTGKVSEETLTDLARKRTEEELGIRPPYDLRFEAKVRMDGRLMGWEVTVDKDSDSDSETRAVARLRQAE